MKKITRSYVPEQSIFPCLGLDTLIPGPQLPPNYSPNLLNVDVNKGLVVKRPGYHRLGGEFADPVMLVVEYEDLDGLRTLLAFTTKKQYKFVVDTETWENVTTQDGGGADVDWTGSVEDTFDYVIASGISPDNLFQKWLIVTNGVDKPRYWDGATARFVDYTPAGISGFVNCRTIASFFNYIVLGNVKTASDAPQAVYWSDAQRLMSFSGGTSGVAVISDIDGEISRLLPLSDRLVIYSENSIAMATFIGGNTVFTFEHVSKATRLVSPTAVVNIGPFHLFLSQENVMLFDGTRLTLNIGDRIFRSYRDELSYPVTYRASAFHDAARQHVYFVVPKTESEAVVYKLEYDLNDIRGRSRWTKSIYPDVPTAGGFNYFSRQDNLRWDSPEIVSVPWDQTTLRWDNASIREGFPVRVFGTGTGVFVSDDADGSDNGADIEAWWDTPDFAVPEIYRSQLGRWIEVELDLLGTDVTVRYSTDEGQSFEDVEVVSPTSEFLRYRIPIDYMARTLRVRVYNTGTDRPFQVRWCRLWVKPGGAD